MKSTSLKLTSENGTKKESKKAVRGSASFSSNRMSLMGGDRLYRVSETVSEGSLTGGDRFQ